jgi:aerobic carbon-monoxide dehydrogenase medium subunit
MYSFEYQRPDSIDEAAKLLADDSANQILAGGMSLVPMMRHHLVRPAALIDLGSISELRFKRVTLETVVIGAMTTHVDVASSAELRMAIPALSKLAGGIGDPLVRNRGTIGGSLANSDPAACYPAALLGLGGIVITTRRRIPADEFFVSTFETALLPGEIILAVEFRRPAAASFIKFANSASRFSIVGLFLSRRGREIRVAVTGAGPFAFRAFDIERALANDFRSEALSDIIIPSSTLIADVHGSAEYRADLIVTLSKRAVQECLK